MKDCRWADPHTQAFIGSSVPLGRKYALSAGLLEITYRSGAKLILEGPCTYQVESRTGGYLELGKLTAKIERREEGRVKRERSEVKGQKSENSSLIPRPSYFVVKTPTAVVTDLGTEFGVEVSKEGNTTSCVFRGSVKVQIVDDKLGANRRPVGTGAGGEGSVVLRANESARVEKSKDSAVPGLFVGGKVGATPKFVRRLYEPPKLLDLLDIVAGGDGTGRRRECGIDPATGKQDTWFLSGQRKDDHGYHPVGWHPFIDGVFIPYVPTSLPPQPQDVQLDSSGNTCDEFLKARRTKECPQLYCTLQGDTIGGIWARAADADSTAKNGWIYALTNAEQFMPEGADCWECTQTSA